MHSPRATTLRTITSRAALALATTLLAACADAPAAPHDAASSGAASLSRSDRDDADETRGAVYTETNSPAGNGIIAFSRAADGALSPLGTFATGGRGAGGTIDPLVSQFAVIVNAEHDALFAVDAGSNQLSSFRVRDDGRLSLSGTVASGGVRPVSLAVHETLLYALNTGDNTLSGYRVTGGARLVALPNGITHLAAGANGAAAVRFTPDGRWLIVAERVSNRLETFAVLPNGRLGAPIVSAASAGASFGFDVTPRNQPVVSETQGSVSSYALAPSGALTPLTASASTGGAATCWVTITSDGRLAVTSNAGSNTLSSFAIDATGRLTSVSTNSTGAGATPIDLDHVGSRFVYVLEAGRGTIGTFRVASDGSLVSRPVTLAGAPASGLQGVAAF